MSIYKIIFSPTGGTEKVANKICEVFNSKVKTVDLTDTKFDFSEIKLTSDDTCVISVPSFGGRVPDIASKRLEKISGNGAKAILVVVYGNRAYDDTLLELKNILTSSGFHCIAAISAVAEHSIMRQFAEGRPDKKDLEKLSEFAKTIKSHIEQNDTFKELNLPGNFPYREYNGVPIKPSGRKNCTHCGICADKCPVQAISKDNLEIDKKKCISCMRCIKVCPSHARKTSKFLTFIASNKMKKSCSIRKENELFIEV